MATGSWPSRRGSSVEPPQLAGSPKRGARTCHCPWSWHWGTWLWTSHHRRGLPVGVTTEETQLAGPFQLSLSGSSPSAPTHGT